MRSEIRLQSSHIFLENQLVSDLFENSTYALVAYSGKQLLVTPSSSLWFTKMHPSTLLLLKTKNINGDKTMAVHPILIEHDIKTCDRDLEYEIIRKTRLIKINLR